VTTTISPSLGAGIDFTQGGVGSSPGYAAIDVRRAALFGLSQGPIGSGYGGGAASGAYAVTQRIAGANMSVDIAASTGGGLAVAGTTISNQGLYVVPPHSGVINETIAAADPTNPRVDQIIVQTFDNAIDSSSKNTSQTVVLTGTPTAGATIGIGGNRNGAAALPANSYRLADVLVPAGAASITNANIFDRRPKARGHTNISTSESRTNAAYGVMPTPDQVTEVVLPTDGLIIVGYQATWQESAAGAARASIFIGSNQLQIGLSGSVSPQATGTGSGTAVNKNTSLATCTAGLVSGSVTVAGTAYPGDVTTGQILGGEIGEMELSGAVGVFTPPYGGPAYIFAAAGTYHVSVQFKASSGSVTVSNRKLWVWTMAPDQAVLA
jgi:hypothetical protein